MAGAFGGDHANSDVGSGLDQFEVDVQAVAEEDGIAVFEMRFDVCGKDVGLGGVGGQQHDQVGPFGGFGVALDGEACFFGLFGRFGAFSQSDHNLNA